MVLQLSTDRSLADWVTLAKVPWDELTKFGPHNTFEAHARLRYEPDEGELPRPEIPARPVDERSDAPVVAELCDLLATETTTPDQCYFCLWDGWPDINRDINPGPTTVHLPHRSYSPCSSARWPGDQSPKSLRARLVRWIGPSVTAIASGQPSSGPPPVRTAVPLG